MNEMPPDSKRSSTLLVLGGARSGKSAYAQTRVEQAAAADGREPVYVATAQAWDTEMTVRIAAHVAARDARWRTVDAPFDLVGVLAAERDRRRILLVDCLTLWLTNIMLRGDDVESACLSLAGVAGGGEGTVVFVSNEVGQGIVPDNALARRFRDAQGRLNQAMAAACAHVVLMAAGLPVMIKPRPAPSIDL